MDLKTFDYKHGLYTIPEDNAAPKFTDIEGALGWLDPSGEDHAAKHALLVGGVQEDGRFRVILEYQGHAGELADMCVDVKDALLVERFWCDGTPDSTLTQLRVQDGLTHYINWGFDRVGNILWHVLEPEKKWRYFRAQRPIAHIVPVPDYIRVDIQGGLDRLVALAHEKQLIVTKGCQVVEWVLAEKRKEIERHPVTHALIWLTWALQERAEMSKRDQMPPQVEAEDEWHYGNRPL